MILFQNNQVRYTTYICSTVFNAIKYRHLFKQILADINSITKPLPPGSQPYSPGTFLRVIGGQVQHIYATHLAVETLSSYGGRWSLVSELSSDLLSKRSGGCRNGGL